MKRRRWVMPVVLSLASIVAVATFISFILLSAFLIVKIDEGDFFDKPYIETDIDYDKANSGVGEDGLIDTKDAMTVREAREYLKNLKADEVRTYEASGDGLIKTIEINQVMSYGQDKTTGELYLMDTFIANKDTAIIVPLAKEMNIDATGQTQFLKIYKEDEEIATLTPTGKGMSDALTFYTDNNKTVAGWEAGNYTFEVTVGGSTATRKTVFKEARDIKILAVPIKANFGGKIESLEGEWETAIGFTQKTYPLGEDDIQYILAPELDLSDEAFDLYTEDGLYNVWQAVADLQTPQEDYELIIGFVRSEQGPDGAYKGYTMGAPATIVAEKYGDMEVTVAHEIAHCYDIGDEYPGGTFNMEINPPPYGMEGRDWNDYEQSVEGKDSFIVGGWDIGSDGTGSVIFPEQYPVDWEELDLHTPVTSFMGTGSDLEEDYWITSAIWEHLYTAFAESGELKQVDGMQYINCDGCYRDIEMRLYKTYGECYQCFELTEIDFETTDDSFVCEHCEFENPATEMNTLFECPMCSSYVPLWLVVQDNEDTVNGYEEYINVLKIRGNMTQEGVFEPLPWWQTSLPVSKLSKEAEGGYEVELIDAKGRILNTHAFKVDFEPQNHGTEPLKVAPVYLNIKCPPATTIIRIKKQGEIIYQQQCSESTPVVEVVGIKENQVLSGEVLVNWKGEDLDGDTLYYNVWYEGEGDPISLATNITDNALLVDFDKLPGCDYGVIFIECSDGVRSSEVRSNIFVVEWKAPEIKNKSEDIPKYKLTDFIEIEAEVYDMQEGWNIAGSTDWYNEEGEQVGWIDTLSIYPYELEPGVYTFNLKVENAKGLTDSATYTIEIINDETGLPNRWSKEDIKYALSLGLVISLDNVEAPISRLEYAEVLYQTLMYTQEAGWAYSYVYDEHTLLDCNLKEEEIAFIMAAAEIMDTTNQKFNPQGQITEQQALDMLEKGLNTQDIGFKAYFMGDAKTIEEALRYHGIIDNREENTYVPDRVLTRERAAIRLKGVVEVFATYYQTIGEN